MDSHRKTGLASIVTATMFWSCTSLFIYFFASIFDPWTYSFFRYFSATIFMSVVSVLFFRSELLASLKHVNKYLLIILILFFFQLTWVVGMKYIQPALGSLIARTRVLMCPLLAYILFQDERESIRDPKFIFGTIIAITGTAVVVLNGEIHSHSYIIGTLILFGNALLGTLYALTLRNVVRTLHPVPSFTVISAGVALSFLVMMLILGDYKTYMHQKIHIKCMVFFASVLCMALPHTLYSTAIQYLGSAISTSITLFGLVGTAILSYLIFGELLNGFQIIGSVLIIIGSLLVIKASKGIRVPNN